MKWDSRAPTNGRPLDAQDVVFSWNKFGQANLLRSNLIYDAKSAPLAPGESIYGARQPHRGDQAAPAGLARHADLRGVRLPQPDASRG